MAPDMIGLALQYDSADHNGQSDFLVETPGDIDPTPFSAKSFEWDISVEDFNPKPNSIVSSEDTASNLMKPTRSKDPFSSAESVDWDDTVKANKATSNSNAPGQDSLFSLMRTARSTGKARRKRRPSPPKKMSELPSDFRPSNYSVLCGKGSENYNAIGNRRFRVTVSMLLQKYKNAANRQEKSDIVRTVMDIMHEACPVGAFVKQENGRWYNVDERTAREKVGAFFRDSLHEHYRSSAKSKIARRKKKRRSSVDGRLSSSSTHTATTASSSDSLDSC